MVGDKRIQSNRLKKAYKPNCKSRLTLRTVLYCTLVGARGAELVDHSSEVLHLSFHHSLHIVHVEQVELLQTTLQRSDVGPGVAQAG